VASRAGGLAPAVGSAAENRAWFKQHQITAVSLKGTPGAGKTALIEATFARLGARLSLCVLQADQAGDLDAARIRRLGCDVFQVHTGTANQLSSKMVGQALTTFKPPPGLLLLENVGSLAADSRVDVGEHARVVVMSVPEGDDKPAKYPHAFRHAQVLVITKLDLLGVVDFDLDACLERALQANPRLQVFGLSVTSGAGMDEWCDWLLLTTKQCRGSHGQDIDFSPERTSQLGSETERLSGLLW